MAKDYYVILGIPSSATQQEIKSAYRRQVKELHPDHSGEDSNPFLRLQKAYSVLKNPALRRAYDDRLRGQAAREVPVEVRQRSAGPERPPVEPITRPRRPGIEEVFLTRSFNTYSPTIEEITDRLRTNFVEAVRPKGEKIESLNVDIPLTLHQAKRGGQVRVMLPVHAKCPVCGGLGNVGWIVCLNCRGRGTIDMEVPVSVPYPAGIIDNHTVMVGLERFGIRNCYLTVRLRVTDEP